MNITINERITDLRTMGGLSQKELTEKIDVPASTLSRIEQGKISNVSNDVLIKLSNFFNVSTDYLLGLIDVKFKKNVELSELGLSNKTLFSLISGNTNGKLLSRIIEHPHFATLLDSADAYFRNAHKAGFQSRNDIINLATSNLKDLMNERPERRTEITHDIRQLNAAKISGDEADLTKLRNIFTSILKNIKADYDNEHPYMEQTDFQEMMLAMKEKSDALQKERPITATDMANITTSVLCSLSSLDFDETTIQLFHELSKHIYQKTANEMYLENNENVL